MQHDLDDLRIAVAGIPDRLEIGIGRMAAQLRELDRETDCGIRLGVGRAAVAVGGYLGVRQLAQVLAG